MTGLGFGRALWLQTKGPSLPVDLYRNSKRAGTMARVWHTCTMTLGPADLTMRK